MRSELKSAPPRDLASAYDSVWIDVGCGDGRFVLRCAREHPETLVIGIDPVREAWVRSARLAARTLAKGGLENATFLKASLEALPADLAGLASTVSVNYPWGSLMRALVAPRHRSLATLVRLLGVGGRLQVLLNASVAADCDYSAPQALPALTADHVTRRMVPGWRMVGLDRISWRFLNPGERPRFRTSWGQRLTVGSGRSTLDLTAERVR